MRQREEKLIERNKRKVKEEKKEKKLEIEGKGLIWSLIPKLDHANAELGPYFKPGLRSRGRSRVFLAPWSRLRKKQEPEPQKICRS